MERPTEINLASLGPEPRPRPAPLVVMPPPWAGLPVTPLPRAVRELNVQFLDVLRARQSKPGRGSLLPVDLASVLWHATMVRERRPASTRFAAWESRAAPSAGGLHVVATLCLPIDQELPVGIHDAAHHTLAALPDQTDETLAANSASVSELIGARHGVTLQFAADMARVDASYEQGTSLAWRDAGVLLAVLTLVAEALGMIGTPLGRTGDAIIATAGLAPPRWIAVGAVHLTRVRNKAQNRRMRYHLNL